MYDGSIACWEAIVMARRITKRSNAILSSGLHPHYVSVAKTMARFTGDDLVYQTPRFDSETDFPSLMAGIDKATSCVLVQYQDILGRIQAFNAIAAKAHYVDPLLFAVLTN